MCASHTGNIVKHFRNIQCIQSQEILNETKTRSPLGTTLHLKLKYIMNNPIKMKGNTASSVSDRPLDDNRFGGDVATSQACMRLCEVTADTQPRV